MPIPMERLKLREDALQLLQKLSGVMDAEGYCDSYQIDVTLLARLGFSNKAGLAAAVGSLNQHAHDYTRFWGGRPPIIRVDEGATAQMLVPGPFIQEAYSVYRAHFDVNDG